MPVRFERDPNNPILVPGGPEWRRAVTFNPGVIRVGTRTHLFERAAGCLRPFRCAIGAWVSEDGVLFRPASPDPVLTPAQCGSEHGSVQDPRVVELDGRYVMTFAWRPFAWSSHPTGVGVPESHETDFPGVLRAPPAPPGVGSGNVAGGRPDNYTRSGIAVSTDLLHWDVLGLVTPADIDDRDVILFPRRIGGRYALLRRPLSYVGPRHGTPGPSIWISFSEDLLHWSEPELVAKPEHPWEDNRIGGSTPPLETEAGWLVFHHGVQTLRADTKTVVYRLGAMLLDRDDPRRVLARCPHFLMEPEAYYERFGLYIPNVIFPTGLTVVDGVIHLYYGVCDTAIALARAPLRDVLDEVLRHPVR